MQIGNSFPKSRPHNTEEEFLLGHVCSKKIKHTTVKFLIRDQQILQRLKEAELKTTNKNNKIYFPPFKNKIRT